MQKNHRIRKALFLAGMTQGELGQLMGLSDPYISKLLQYELAKSEQDEIIRLIREADAQEGE